MPTKARATRYFMTLIIGRRRRPRGLNDDFRPPARAARGGRFWLITVAAVLALAATVSLGRWQLSRAAQKEALQAEIDAQKSAARRSTSRPSWRSTRPRRPLHRPVRLRGLWLAPHTVYLDNRQMHGVPGFYVRDALRARRQRRRPCWCSAAGCSAISPTATQLAAGRDAGRPGRGDRRGSRRRRRTCSSWARRRRRQPGAGSSPIRQNLDLEAFRAETGLPLRTDVSLQQTGAGFRGPAARLAGARAGRRKALRLCIPVVRALRPSSQSSMSGSNSSPPSAAHAAPCADEPLGLTVHSMPSPRQALDGAEGRRTVHRPLEDDRWCCWCCAAPVIASYFTYYVVRPEGRRVYGELIDPQRPLPALAAHHARRQRRCRCRTLKGQWLLVAVAGAACDALCEQQLYLQRQLRESLGREKDRLDRVWLVSDAAPVPERLDNGLRGATVLRVPAAQLAQWLAPAPGHALAEHLYVVDPMGNWMMRFPAAHGRGRRQPRQARPRAPAARLRVVGRAGPLDLAMDTSSLYDLTPIAWLHGAWACCSRSGPLAWVWRRNARRRRRRGGCMR